MLTIDGSTLEGGGQLTRLAFCLSALTGTSVRVHSIRAGRGSSRSSTSSSAAAAAASRKDRRGRPAAGGGGGGGGGLKDSHLAALEFLASQCGNGTRLDGAEVGSTQVTFRPKPPPNPTLTSSTSGEEDEGAEKYHSITLTKPGSVWLIFQAVFPYLVFSTDWTRTKSIYLTLRGGTNVPKAMSTEYMDQVAFPLFERIGLPRCEVTAETKGWAGHASRVGEVRVRICAPSATTTTTTTTTTEPETKKFTLEPFTLAPPQGTTSKIDATIQTTNRDTFDAALACLTSQLDQVFPGVPVHVHASSTPTLPDRPRTAESAILLVAHTTQHHRLGADFLGPLLGKSVVESDRRVQAACRGVVAELRREVDRGGCVDRHARDQLVVFQALADGVSVVDGGGGAGEETLHTKTAEWVCGLVLEEYGVRFEGDGRCVGIGWNGITVNKKEDDVGVDGLVDEMDALDLE